MKILERYILKENITPFLVSLMVTTFVMLLDKLIDLLNLIIEKKLDVFTIISIFSLSLPFMLALTVPMAVLLASIMSFGRFSVDNELVAFKSCGINVYTLMRPTVIAAVFLSLFMIYFNNSILPETNHKLKNLMIKANYRRPVTAIVPGTFTSLKNYTIYAKDRVEDQLLGIIIYVREGTKFPQTITAARGNIELRNGGNSLKAYLYDGQMHERDNTDPASYQLSSFKRFVLNLPDLGYQLNEEGSDYRGDRELSSKAMQKIVKTRSQEKDIIIQNIKTIKNEIAILESDSLKHQYATERELENERKRNLKKNQNMLKIESDRLEKVENDINKYLVELHKKYSIAVACLIFVLIGAPIGMMTRTSGIGMAFTVSSFVFLIYYGTLTLGEELADKGVISPFIAMWISNIIFAILGIYLIIISVKELKFINIQGFLQKIARRIRLQ
ncbi:MAG: LptF/LptG family permease [Candidatus Cloacimonetes bacterium]|nr:LptF/LptG family permease [Candidatus Cloacimonadota bacterium]